MSFSSKWPKSKFEMSERIDRMDKKPGENIFVNTVNGNQESEKQSSGDFVNIVNGNGKLKSLLQEVGAHIRFESDGRVLVFNPPLAGPGENPDRWQMALELEQLFFELN